MRDHQKFEETTLENGIVLHTYQDDFPISCMEIQLPIGSGHAIAANGLLAGSPHFLEHTQLIRSVRYPEPYALDRALGLKAGNSNAATHPKTTTHWIDTPAEHQDFGIDLLVDRVFNPLFEESDLATERSVVMNERNQNKFYPAKSKASQYYFRDFIGDLLYPLEQIFGSDQDLESMDVDRLRAMHQMVSSSDSIVALAVGPGPFDHLAERLSALPTQKRELQTRIMPTSWAHKDHHTVYFDTVPQPRLEVAWIHPRLPFEEYRSVCFMINLLINTTQGPLYREFREEKGWTYGLDATCLMREHNLVTGLTFPVNTIDQIDYIRSCLADRITAAGKDQQLVENEITRQLGNQVYNYQTAGSIVSSASSDLIVHGRINTEAAYEQSIRAMADPIWRTHILETYFRPEDMGSACFLPERRQ